MNIIKIAVKRRITVMMLFVCIVMLGLVSFGRLGYMTIYEQISKELEVSTKTNSGTDGNSGGNGDDNLQRRGQRRS